MSINKLQISESPRPSSKRNESQVISAGRRGWTPPPRINVPDWADRYRKLKNGSRWSTATAEIARGPMLAVTEPGVHVITVMVCTQLLKTSLLENTFGFHAHLDPCDMLMVQPKDDAAEQFSKERITPFVRATPELRKLVGTGKTRDVEETLTYKAFPGGFLAIVGAGSPDNLARRPVRIVLYDEVDKYPITREGDPISLGDERMATFVNWLSIRACSPTVEDESRIAASYAQSDQRRASVVCPHCQHRQFLDFFKHVNWDKDGSRHRTETARIYCESCGAAWSEGNRLRALQTARWHQTKTFECCGAHHDPIDEYQRACGAGDEAAIEKVWRWWAGDRWAVYRAFCPVCKRDGIDNVHAGFQAGKLYSPWPKDRPTEIAAKWIAAQGDEDRKQVWFNTQAGIPYRAYSGKELRAIQISSRSEVWSAEVPDGVAVITVGVDVQGDRLEVEIVGWGRDEESWSIAHIVIDGDPELPATWNRLDDLLKRKCAFFDGRALAIAAACIDSGGHHTQRVYEFAKARLGRHIWAIKGESAQRGARSPVWPTKRPSRRTKASFRPVIIGVNAAKDTVRNRLQMDEAGPGYMHFPADRDMGYFEQLISERIVTRVVNGQKFRIWDLPHGRANEALDCRVYAYAALCGLFHLGLKLNARAAAVTAAVGTHAPAVRSPTVHQLNALPVPEPTAPSARQPSIKTEGDKKKSVARRLAGG